MKIDPLKHKQITIRFLHRTIRFLLSCLAAAFILFLAGNGQDFLDNSQFIILRIQIVTGALLFLVAVGALLFELHQVCILGRKKYIGSCIISFFTGCIGLGLAIVSITIIVLSAGMGSG